MHRAFTYCHKKHFDRIVIIGTDCLTITVKDIEQAFKKLGAYDCVLGPSKDGGYYLIGLKGPNARLFTGIKWGTSSVLEQTVRKAGRLKKKTFLLREKEDIDTVSDLKRLSKRIKDTNIAPHTQKILT